MSLEGIALLCFVLAIIGALIKQGVKEGTKSGSPPHTPSPPPGGPGKFRVSGVDRTSKLDVVGYYDAASPENARAKAELDDMVVTKVERA